MATVVFRDDFDGAAGSIDGRVTMGRTWEGLGDESLDGAGLFNVGSGSARVPLGASLNGSTPIEVELGCTTADWQGLRVTLAQNDDYASDGIGYGFRYDMKGQYGPDTDFSVNGNVTTDALTPLTGSPQVLMLRFDPAASFLEFYVGGVLAHSAPTSGGPIGDIAVNMNLNIAGAYGPLIDYIEVRLMDSVIPPFWTSFVGSREIIE